jgi:hypothetical protein
MLLYADHGNCAYFPGFPADGRKESIHARSRLGRDGVFLLVSPPIPAKPVVFQTAIEQH